MMRRALRGTLFGLLLLAALGGGAGLHAVLTRPPAPLGPADGSSASAGQLQLAFIGAVQQVRPAVVNIGTVQRGTGRRPFGPEPYGRDDPQLREFFEQFFGPGPSAREFRLPGVGSGVIIDRRGYILTNFHVVKGADEIMVKLASKREYRGQVVGTDPTTDLAVIRIQPDTELAVAALGNSDQLKVGEWAIAIGNPFGLTQTVTVGVISATGRSDVGIANQENFIQTDASINPGNSGGPLLNVKGEVVGINTAIVSLGHGIGFAIPINMAKRIYTDLVARGKVARGWLGVSVQPLTAELAKSFGAKADKGVLIADVVQESPAHKAGLQPGDIILDFDGKKVEGPPDLQRAVGLTNPGKAVQVKIWRDRGEQQLEVKIVETPDEGQVLRSAARGKSLLGLEVRAITPELARQLGLRNAEGVQVSRVEDGSPAEEAGIQRGDVIREINRQRVKALGDYDRMVRDLKPGDRVTVLLQRGPMSLYVAFTLARG